MLEDSVVLGTPGGGGASADAVSAAPVIADAAVAASAEAQDGGTVAVVGDGDGGGSNSGEDERGRVEEGDKSFGGNRWPRQETLALLKIRSDMDVAFRDASVKGPLWEEVSRKLAELGYHRNAKKCKEKFENVYKYHKRTKEGRSGKSEGKTYRFFDQLQALEKNPAIHGIQSPTPVSIVVTTTTTTPSSTTMSNNITTVPSTTTSSSLTLPQAILNITPPSTLPSNPTTYFPTQTPNPTSNNNNISTPPNSLSNSSSFSTSSEETTTTTTMGGKRKRKWKEFFERLMKEVVEKQEELQRRFLEAIEKREQERVVREEAWRTQEMQRINREREILAQERSISAAKDAAVMAFLQKIAQHQQQEVNLEPALNNNNNIIIAPQQQVPQPTPNSTSQQAQTRTVPEASQVQPLVPQTQPQHHQQVVNNANVEINKADDNNNNDNKGENLMMGGSSSRWPKVEVQALIDLRTNLETKYQETGPKGPLWEEISALMRKMGYNRNAKRCKEKWENINKYFKKVKESNKKRPQDCKTCPYFHQLEALYREKSKVETQMKPQSTMMAPLMVQPEQQWPPQHHVMPPEITMGDTPNDPMDRRHHEGEAEEDEDNKDVRNEDEEEDEEEDGNYEIVASKPASGEE